MCNGNGECGVSEDDPTKAICHCSESVFSGLACEVTCPNTFMKDSVLVECNNHGTCENAGCTCDMGYYGEGCDKSCPGLLEDAASTKECNGNGVCNITTFQCECNAGDFVPGTCPFNSNS